MKLIKSSWKSVTVAEYRELVRIQKRHPENDYSYKVEILACLMQVPEYEVWGLPAADFHELWEQASFIDDFKVGKDKVFSCLSLDGRKYRVCTDLARFTVSQYVDFQMYWKQANADDGKNMCDMLPTLLSVLVVPFGKSYGEGYDVREVIDDIDANMSIDDAQSLLYFFAKRLRISTEDTRAFLEFLTTARTMPAVRRMKWVTRILDRVMAREIRSLTAYIGGFA